MRKIFLTPFLLVVFSKAAFAIHIDWKHGLEGFVARCFDRKDVHVFCDDLAGSDEKIIREELNIEANSPSGYKFIYIYGKGIEGPLCQKHLKKIRELIRNVEEVCVSGESEMKVDNGETIVRWNSLETKRGEVFR